MSGDHDWLVGDDRGSAAAEKIYQAATEMIARDGLSALDIDVLARRLHCSRATVYRHAGGKARIVDEVMARAARRIVESVGAAVADLSGSARIVTAVTVALAEIRSDPLGQLMVQSIRAQDMSWITASPVVTGYANELNGLTDGDLLAAQWITRITLALLYWPIGDPTSEQEALRRFVAPAFGAEQSC